MSAALPAETSLTVLELARAGRFAEIRDLFAPNLRALVSAAVLQAAWDAELARRGAVCAIGRPASEPAHGGVVVVRVPVSCERGELTLVASVTEAGELAGLQLAPAGAAEPVAAWEPPDYADPGTFDEQEVTLGTGPLAVPGTLSLPRRPGPRPAVVLLAGSGPLDRDETLGRNKPFKDLAWGLSSQGVAVLRFDKVTHAHPREVGEARHFTIVDEYLPHAVAAIRLLRARPALDAGPIFLLGHSLGGTVAPRVAAGERSVAGLVLLAAGTQPLHWAAVRQVRYLASLEPETAAASEHLIEAMSGQARLVDSPDLSPSTPASELPFGVPASYWLDLRAYDPVAAAAALDRPMLILQGGRDYQATVADDLGAWEAGLAHRPDVTVRVYPPDNHMFFPGAGPSKPAEYEPAQHVDRTVVTDIGRWLTTVAGRVPGPGPKRRPPV
jgi:dienelactone hydrolase